MSCAYTIDQSGNAIRKVNEVFPAFECYYNPRIKKLRKKYHLDAVVAGLDEEWERILALRHWIAETVAIENDNPTPCEMDVFALLDAALAGGKFHCAHFSIIQHAILNSFGYVARRMNAGPGQIDSQVDNHGVNEVWVNSLAKWVLVDAKYDIHFEKEGLPLSALEVRDEVWKGGGQSVTIVKGPQHRPFSDDNDLWTRRVETYRNCGWEPDTNRFTGRPTTPSSALIVYADEIFESNTWYRSGKPHWAYEKDFFLKVKHRDFIEWTPNVIEAHAVAESDQLNVQFKSCTPNFKRYEVRTNSGPWYPCGDSLTMPLDGQRIELRFRTLNLFGVCGPEHCVICRPTSTTEEDD